MAAMVAVTNMSTIESAESGWNDVGLLVEKLKIGEDDDSVEVDIVCVMRRPPRSTRTPGGAPSTDPMPTNTVESESSVPSESSTDVPEETNMN